MTKKTEKDTNEAYLAIGIVFTLCGIAMVFNESTRPSGLGLMVPGVVFLVMSFMNSSNKETKNK